MIVAKTPAGMHWERLTICHHHGIAVPLFSLRSSQSCGIGEYLDLLPLIDWCAEVGFDMIQLLPLNDSGSDQSPYSALTALGLHPIYLSLDDLKVDPAELAPLRAQNTLPRVAVQQVGSAKLQLVRSVLRPRLREIQSDEAYQRFVEENPWVWSYALFRVLSEWHQGLPWDQWKADLREPTPEQLASLQEQHAEEIALLIAMQYFCDMQLRRVKLYATTKGVALMGDLPILLSPNSVDVWLRRELFDLSQTVGAPPDQYSKEGQNWSFPLYNWEAMRNDHFDWWKERLKLTERYFHCYRVDHVVGFYRLWAIPLGEPGSKGRFIPSELEPALALGHELMTFLLEQCPLLPIGEDLGAVPVEVKHSLRGLGIPGTRIMRWERFWEGDRHFIPPAEYSPLSVTMVSNHDLSPLTLWWTEKRKETEELCRDLGWQWQPKLSRQRLLQLLQMSHHSGSLLHVNPLQEYLALFPELVSAHPQEERINIPGQISKTNWTYRFRPSLEELTAHDGLKAAVREILA